MQSTVQHSLANNHSDYHATPARTSRKNPDLTSSSNSSDRGDEIKVVQHIARKKDSDGRHLSASAE